MTKYDARVGLAGLALNLMLSCGVVYAATPSIQQASSVAVPAKTWNVDLDPARANFEFRATGHPSALKILGKSSAVSGSFRVSAQSVTGTAVLDLSTLDTGIDMRTRHMKEKYLETGKSQFQNAKFSLVKMVLPALLVGASTDKFAVDQVPFEGTLLLHGVEKPVAGTAKIERNGGVVNLRAEFSLKISDYKIDVPSFAGITMADTVDITLEDTASVVIK